VTLEILTPREAAIAGLLHDIGKLAQRAHPNEEALRDAYRAQGLDGLQACILPPGRHGRYTHRHALWSDFFFEKGQMVGACWPAGLDAKRLRGAAIRHHNPQPDNPADWIIAEADRLASGLERKTRDEEAELAAEERPAGFREVELAALVPRLAIGLGDPPKAPLRHPAEEISAAALLPRAPAPADQPRRFGALWDGWLKGWAAFARHGLSEERFEQAALALSERLLWAVPSSTVDQPDVSLHEHAQAVAAIAAALAAFHGAEGSFETEAIRDRARPKFRLVALDLSGIQAALFRLDRSAGAARILRARSFLMAETVSAVLLALRERLDLPAASVMIAAGGKAELLAPALPDLDARIEAAREALDAWMVAQWQGDLALNLAAGAPFAAKAFMDRGRGLPAVRAEFAQRLEAAKHRPFAAWRGGVEGFLGTGAIAAPFTAEGACASCGARPATVASPLDGAKRCVVCDAAYGLGQRLPKATGFSLVAGSGAGADAAPEEAAQDQDRVPLPLGFALVPSIRPGAASRRVVRFEGAQGEAGSAVPRPEAHVPRIADPNAPHYRHLGLDQAKEGETPPEKGDLMTFAHIAAEALEQHPKGGFRGRALLGVLKADVDRLGQVFARGLGADTSPARIAQLSRLMDGYFARRLPWLLRNEFPATYTVYAGGDDLLLVAPWRFALPLALRLSEDFRAFAGGNPNLTLSAGIAFVHADHPIARAVEEAEEMLERAKDEGRDRLGLFGRALSWKAAQATTMLAEDLHQRVREEALPPTFLHRMRGFAAMRRAVEKQDRGADAGWNARWQYHKARFLERCPSQGREAMEALLLRALPPPAAPAEGDAEIATTIALWRNR